MLCYEYQLLDLKDELDNSMPKCTQALEEKIGIVYRAKAKSVMTIRSNLREKLDSGYIDLRKFLRKLWAK